MIRQRGQVLAFLAITLPMLLLPIAAYAVDAAVVSARFAGLQSATAQAAELAAQQLDVRALRAGGGIAIDPATVRLIASQALTNDEPGAIVESVSVTGAGAGVTINSAERVDLPLPLWQRTVVLHARAEARLVAGYDSPSSLLPLSSSTF